MLLTESAAREKWCPQARIPHQTAVGAVGINRAPGARASACCIAVECMSWRWAGWRNKTFGTVAPCPDRVERDGERLGFCGLAGKPEMGREP